MLINLAIPPLCVDSAKRKEKPSTILLQTALAFVSPVSTIFRMILVFEMAPGQSVNFSTLQTYPASPQPSGVPLIQKYT